MKKLNILFALLLVAAITLGATTSPHQGVPENSGRGAYSNLVIIRPTVATVDVDADSLTLSTATATFDALAVDETCTISSSGANGLDTGSEASDTFYSVWAIYNGTVVDCLLSLSATAPTMPSGYTFKMRVGWVYNDSGSDIEDFFQYGNRYSNVDSTVDNFVANGTADTLTQVSPNVPSTASRVIVITVSVTARNPFTINGQNSNVSIDGTAYYGMIAISGNPTIMPLNASQQFYYERDNASGNVNYYNGGWIDQL